MFEVISKALHGIFNTLVAVFLPALSEISPEILEKLPGPSACVVLSLTDNDFFLLHIE